jgi:DNA repair protein RadC
MNMIDFQKVTEGNIGEPIRVADDIVRILAHMRELEMEVFVTILLDGKNKVKRKIVTSVGTLTGSLVHPREVYCEAVRERAAAIVVAHNHPSGDPTPSKEDLEVSARLKKAGELLGIALLDSVVIGRPGFISMKTLGYL